MMIPAWQVITWEPVYATLGEFEQCVAQMRHLGTSVHLSGERPTTRYGQTLWGADIGGRSLGIAWDWGKVRGNVVALADPMRILSNVQLIDDEGACVDVDERIVHLNNAIHGLGWQDQVAAELTERLAA